MATSIFFNARIVIQGKMRFLYVPQYILFVICQVLFEKNIGAFSHKNGKVREELLILLQNTLNM